jgi:hypothetical protein
MQPSFEDKTEKIEMLMPRAIPYDRIIGYQVPSVAPGSVCH